MPQWLLRLWKRQQPKLWMVQCGVCGLPEMVVAPKAPALVFCWTCFHGVRAVAAEKGHSANA